MSFSAVALDDSGEKLKEALVAFALLNDYVDPEYSDPPDKKHGVVVFLVDKGVNLGEYSRFLTGPFGDETKAHIDLRFRGRKFFYKLYGRDSWGLARDILYRYNPKLKAIHEQHPDKEILLAGVSKFLTRIPFLNNPNNYYIVKTVL